jgi:hypothetical protein
MPLKYTNVDKNLKMLPPFTNRMSADHNHIPHSLITVLEISDKKNQKHNNVVLVSSFYIVEKGFAIFLSPAGMPWPGIIYP